MKWWSEDSRSPMGEGGGGLGWWAVGGVGGMGYENDWGIEGSLMQLSDSKLEYFWRR